MIAGVFAYARTRLKALGYREWTGGFTFKNIPITQLDSAFYLELGKATGQGNNQDALFIRVPLTVRLFKGPASNIAKSIDQGIAIGDKVIDDFMTAEHRTTQDEIKNIEFESFGVDPLSDSDDSGVIIEINFRAYVVMSAR